MPIIETEIWKRSPDNPRALIFDSQRVALDIFNELETHLKTEGRMPDEYFLFDARGSWKDGALFPRDAQVLCSVNYGGSEGVWLDISVQYEKEVYEYSRENGVLGWHKRTVIEPFATGKTLGETIDDLDKMNLVASSVTAAFYGMEAEVKERYAKIERGEVQPPYPPSLEKPTIATAKTIFGDVQAGDWVIATGEHSCSYLIGQVKEIIKIGMAGHREKHEHDDVHVDFAAFEYPPERIVEIEEHFSRLFGEPKRFEELPLHSICIPPDKLIRISHLDHDEITRMGSLRANCEAFCNCFPSGDRPEGKLGELMERLDANLEAYQDSLMGFGKRELIEMAEKINAMSDVHLYLTDYHEYEDSEIEYLLLFQNPLEVVADAWVHRREDIGDLAFTLDDVFGDQDLLQSYALAADTVDEIPDYMIPEYGMDAGEFEKRMAEMFPEGNPAAMSQWITYAGELETDELILKATYLLELLVEFDLTKQHYGGEIALQVFNFAETSCLNVWEVRAVADLIKNGMTDSTLLLDKTLEGCCGRDEAETAESKLAIWEFVSHESQFSYAKADTPPAAIPMNGEQIADNQDLTERADRITGNTVPIPPLPAEPLSTAKKSIGDRLREGNEKVQAYKDKQAQNPPTAQKHTKKEELS